MLKILMCALTYKADKSDESVYIENVTRELSKNNLVYVMLFNKNKASFPVVNENIFFVTYSDLLSSSFITLFWHLFILPFCINYKKFDFMILPEVADRFFCRYPIFTVAVIHEVVAKERARSFGFVKRFFIKKLVPKYMAKANNLMCTSETTFAKVVESYGVDERLLSVNYPGYDKGSFNERIIVDRGALKAEYGLKNDFILYAADIEYPKNNHINLIKAYDRLPDAVKQSFDLVFLGQTGVGADVVLQYAKHSDYSSNIKFLSKIPEKYIPALYKMATVYVQPSVEDACGSRLIEAMACGTPVVCSDHPSLVEIGGDAIHCCGADDFEEISMLLDAVLGFVSERRDMSSKGLQIVGRFDWVKHVESIVNTYNQSHESVWSERFREVRNSLDNELSHPERRCKALLSALPFHFSARLIEQLIAALLFVAVTVPIFILLAIRKIVLGSPIFSVVEVIGRRKDPVNIKYFNSRLYYIKNISLLWYVVTNRFALVGVGLREWSGSDLLVDMAYVYNRKPGLFNPWYASGSFKRDAGERHEVEWDYVARQGLVVNMWVLVKSITAFLSERQWARSRGFIDLFGLKILNVTQCKFVELLDCAIHRKEKRKVTFVTAKRLSMAVTKDEGLLQALGRFHYLLPSGGSIGFVGQLLRTPLVQDMSSADLMPAVYEMAAAKGYRIYLIGGPLGVSTKMMARLGREYPELDIIGENQACLGAMRDVHLLFNRINEVEPDIVLVSMDTPSQEQWINRYSEKINSSIIIGVGDLFEVCSGNIKRTSWLTRNLGFEWLVRAVREKGAFPRFVITSPLFVVRVLRWAMKGV